MGITVLSEVVMSYLLFVCLLICRVKGFSVKQESVVGENMDGGSDEICGDPECNLVCGEDQECRPTGDQCVMPPCCVAWGCVDQNTSREAPANEECPVEWPEMGSACSLPGLTCEYGWEICCGEEIPDVIFSCEDGVWQMIWVDSRCDIGLPCDTTTTTKEIV